MFRCHPATAILALLTATVLWPLSQAHGADAARATNRCGEVRWEAFGYAEWTEVMKVILVAVGKHALEPTGVKDRTVGYEMRVDTCTEATTIVRVVVSMSFDSAMDIEGSDAMRHYLVKIPPIDSGLDVEVELLDESEVEPQ